MTLQEGALPDAGHSTAQEAAPWPSAARNMTSSFSSNLGMMARRSSYMHVRHQPVKVPARHDERPFLLQFCPGSCALCGA